MSGERAQVLSSRVIGLSEGWTERRAGEERLEGGQEPYLLLSQGGEIASEASERYRSPLRAETARDLLLRFEQAQVPLRLVVIKGNRQIVEEGEDLVLPEEEPFEQVADRELLEPSTLMRPARGRRIGGGLAARPVRSVA